ncbi:hypothetical protein N7536_000136 [Penicillium majusculum]|nr:hypothetical protein N7536_000136 [Penicillium majusculum]
MHFFLIAILAIIQAGTSHAGTLEVIDHDRQCLIWSTDNFGCTGYSASFGLLDGIDCSKLSEVVNGNRHELNVLKVDVCGTEDGSPVAWIQVNRTGLVTFSNINGNQSSCVLNDGLKAGSWCITTEKLDKTNSPFYSSTCKLPTSTPSSGTPTARTPSARTLSTSTPSTSTPSTTIPSTSTPSTSTPSTSTPSTSTPSTSTPSTSTPSTSTPSTSTPSTSTPSTSTPSTSTPSTSTPSTSTPSTSTPSTSTPSTSTPSTSTPSTSTPSTSTPSTSTPSTSTPSTSTPSTTIPSTTTTEDNLLTIVTVASLTSSSTSIVWVTV